jgi:hypothetical protein
MHNTFIARLLAKSAPTPDAAALDVPATEPAAVEDAAIPTPGVEAVAVEKATAAARSGSFARPVVVRGTRMPSECLWATCGGTLTGQGHDRYLCSSCATWFELLPPDFGVYVGDLADDFSAVAETEWVM